MLLRRSNIDATVVDRKGLHVLADWRPRLIRQTGIARTSHRALVPAAGFVVCDRGPSVPLTARFNPLHGSATLTV
jgi:hypothetical protein